MLASLFKLFVVTPVLLVALAVLILHQFPFHPFEGVNWKTPNKDLSIDKIVNLKYESVTTAPNVQLQVLTAGEDKGTNDAIVFLHGFPESALLSFGEQIAHFSQRGYFVLAPDQRGYNYSSKPEGVFDYEVSKLVEDVTAVVQFSKREKVYLVAHDWGAIVAWSFASQHPELLKKLFIINVPHANAMKGFDLKTSLKQLIKSWYMYYINLSGIVEHRAQKNDFAFVFSLMHAGELAERGAIGKPVIERYKQLYNSPGTITSSMNWYRALLRGMPFKMFDKEFKAKRSLKCKVPTFILWGDEDRYLSQELAQLSYEHGLDESVKSQSKVVHLPGVSHWVTHEKPEETSKYMEEFFAK